MAQRIFSLWRWNKACAYAYATKFRILMFYVPLREMFAIELDVHAHDSAHRELIHVDENDPQSVSKFDQI